MGNSEKKTTGKRREGMSKETKITEGRKQAKDNEEILNKSPGVSTQEVSACHPDQKTSASIQSQNSGSVHLSSNPEQWCSCNGMYISTVVLCFILLWFVSELPEKISQTWWSSVGSILH